ncbi:Receptor expression-enhancing protein 6 [Trichoplax sp. H2]|uniref:Receptor expression-enhancing protein n=1 Tax=Trichoplax adhaerens TaxID=10228 RepID=B3RSD9_TRIAD|nr:expressed hypothetical protein [Trichoplax adhaerens]EDV26498.1 expressed hypothetical protein [Trichoplax adhaerens]RDD46265.1 Receptor expression-enhancing protein 6 [Trichoplax sp. H2]|eukprot:XP_002110494.1 expressed hypothetical protein [Trichoplax adhaerens]
MSNQPNQEQTEVKPTPANAPADNGANELLTARQKLEKFLNEKNAVTDVLNQIEEQTGVQKIYQVGGLGGFLAFYMAVGYGAQILCNVLGFAYPAVASIKAIESEGSRDDRQWLTYWVVYAVFNILEYFSDLLLSWFPFYFLMKLLFLCWCMAPVSWNGSHIIYFKIIRPWFLRHEQEIERDLNMIETEVTGAANAAVNVAKEHATTAAQQHLVDQMQHSVSGNQQEPEN